MPRIGHCGVDQRVRAAESNVESTDKRSCSHTNENLRAVKTLVQTLTWRGDRAASLYLALIRAQETPGIRAHQSCDFLHRFWGDSAQCSCASHHQVHTEIALAMTDDVLIGP